MFVARRFLPRESCAQGWYLCVVSRCHPFGVGHHRLWPTTLVFRQMRNLRFSWTLLEFHCTWCWTPGQNWSHFVIFFFLKGFVIRQIFGSWLAGALLLVCEGWCSVTRLVAVTSDSLCVCPNARAWFLRQLCLERELWKENTRILKMPRWWSHVLRARGIKKRNSSGFFGFVVQQGGLWAETPNSFVVQQTGSRCFIAVVTWAVSFS